MNEGRPESPERPVITGDQMRSFLLEHTEEQLSIAGVATQRIALNSDESWIQELRAEGLGVSAPVGTTVLLKKEEWVIVENNAGKQISLARRGELEDLIRER